MANFHRLAVPSYFGGLPGGYDYINNALVGTPSFADNQKVGGPNNGTYFVGFGEDATSSDANRANKALSQNTDYIDNILRQDLVQLVKTANTTAGAPVPTIVVAGTNNIWCGSGGYVLADLFHVVDGNDRDIEVSGTQVVVASIAGGVVGTGFAAGAVTLTLNVSIPTGVTYHVVYCQRTNLAVLPIDAMTLPFLRDQNSVDGSVVDFVAQISAPGLLGSNVTSLAAYSFETPDGTRLAKTPNMYFDCDPTDSGATIRAFNWRTRRDGTVRNLATMYDDPTGATVHGLTGFLRLAAGTAFSSAGTMNLQDGNTTGGALFPMYGFWPLSGNVPFKGDSYPLLFDAPIAEAAFGSNTPPSLINYVNGRWCCTVGDGGVSYGDFSGPSAISDAMTYAAAVGITSLHIQVKAGTYTIAAANVTTGNVVIEGVSPAQTLIYGTVSVGAGMFNMTAGQLRLKNLSLLYTSGTQVAVAGGAATSLFMDEVHVGNQSILMVDSATGVNSPFSAVYCRRCKFAATTAGLISVDLRFNLNIVHSGYFFDECAWSCADETQPVRIRGNAATGTTVSRVLFQACAYVLGGTATTGGHHTTNTGVLEIDPNGGNGTLYVEDISWIDCVPLCFTALANAVLARVYPLALGTTGNAANIGCLTIRGGRWTCNQVTGTNFSPFLLAATQVVVDDVIFVGNTSTSGGPSSEDGHTLDGVTNHTAAQWAQFIFAPGAAAVAAVTPTVDQRLDMRSVTFSGLHDLSNSGDVWLLLQGAVAIQNIKLCDYDTAGSGVVPDSRLRVTPVGVVDGYIKGVTLFGIAPSSTWTTDTRGLGAIAVLMPTVAAQASQSLPIEGLRITNFGDLDDCLSLYNRTTGAAGEVVVASNDSWLYALIDCTTQGGIRGLALYGHDEAGSAGSGATLDCFSMIRGSYNLATHSGVHLNPDIVGVVLLDGVRACNNGNFGLTVIPASWGFAAGHNSCLMIKNGMWLDNLSGNGQVQVAAVAGAGADYPTLIFQGNTCLLTDSLDSVKLNYRTGGVITALPTPADLGTYRWWGVETEIHGTPPTRNLGYTSGHAMFQNVALLLTP